MGTYAALFGGDPKKQLGSIATSTQNQTQSGAPAPTAAAQPTAAGQAPTPTLTFAQMQQAGQARPAPPPVAPTMPNYGGSLQARQGRSMLAEQAQQAMAQPTRYDLDTFNQLRQAGQADLNAQFGNQRVALDEELARRGLYDSTIAANQYRDLGGQQARAMAGLDAQLLQDAAATQMSDRLAAAGLSGQLAQLAGSQDLAAFEANRVGQAMNFENDLRSRQFGESTRQFDIQQQLANALGLGGLGLEAMRLDQQGQQFGQQMELSRDELALRGDLGQQEQDLARARLTQEGTLAQAEQNLERDRLAQQGSQFGQTLSFNRDQLSAQNQQSDLDRQLRQLLGMGELGLGQQRIDQTGEQFGQNLALQREELAQRYGAADADRMIRQQELAQQNQQFGQTLDFNREQFAGSQEQSNLDRQLREILGLGELSGTYQGADGQTYNTVARDRLATDTRMAENDMFFRLAQALSGMSADQLRAFQGSTGSPPIGSPPIGSTPRSPVPTTGGTQTGTPTEPIDDPYNPTPRQPRTRPDAELVQQLMAVLYGGG